ncbi:MAG TPA: hypothetical protein VG692_13485 [Gemmatimonadales bacterium]|nr:hypothetical protein [Gemmatimonadales bacterium]
MLSGLLLAAAILTPPCRDLPLRPGTRWSYDARVAWSVPGSDSIGRGTISWTTEVVSSRSRDTLLAAVVRGWPTELAWWAPGQAPKLSVVFCRANRVFHLEPYLGTAASLADSLLAGSRMPSQDDLILDLPLHVDQLFGREASERADFFYAWYVDSVTPAPGVAPGDSTYYLTYRTMPDHQLVGFVPKVGVVSYTYGHHGTVAEADAHLTRFTRAQE